LEKYASNSSEWLAIKMTDVLANRPAMRSSAFFWDRQNALLVEATPEAVLSAFGELVDSASLRQQLVDGGLSTMRELSWESEMQQVFEHVAARIQAAESLAPAGDAEIVA
jgi:hypothetical protein